MRNLLLGISSVEDAYQIFSLLNISNWKLLFKIIAINTMKKATVLLTNEEIRAWLLCALFDYLTQL